MRNPMDISTAHCPNCDANLNLKTPKPQGTRIRCPRCKEPFTLEQPKAPAPKKKKQPIPEKFPGRKSAGKPRLRVGDDVGERHVTKVSKTQLQLKGSVVVSLILIIGGGALFALGVWLGSEVWEALFGDKKLDASLRGLLGIAACLGFGLFGVFAGLFNMATDIYDGKSSTITRTRFFGLMSKKWPSEDFSAIVVKIEKPDDDDQWCNLDFLDHQGKEVISVGFVKTDAEEAPNTIHCALYLSDLLDIPIEVDGRPLKKASDEFLDALDLVEK